MLCGEHLIEARRNGSEITFVDGRVCRMCEGEGGVHGQWVGPDPGGRWVSCPECLGTGYDPALQSQSGSQQPGSSSDEAIRGALDNPDSTHYDILDVPRNASQADIATAYRRLALIYHPDVDKSPGATRRFQRINAANQALSDPQSRSTYDVETRGRDQSRQASQEAARREEARRAAERAREEARRASESARRRAEESAGRERARQAAERVQEEVRRAAESAQRSAEPEAAQRDEVRRAAERVQEEARRASESAQKRAEQESAQREEARRADERAQEEAKEAADDGAKVSSEQEAEERTFRELYRRPGKNLLAVGLLVGVASVVLFLAVGWLTAGDNGDANQGVPISQQPTPTPVLVSTPPSASIPVIPVLAPTTIPTYTPTPPAAPIPVVPAPEPTPTLISTSTPVPIATPVPVLIPTSSPIPIPTPVPTLAPTSIPTPTSTPAPVPSPTATLIPTVTPTPTPVPTSTPTPIPTPTPTPTPIPSPTSTPVVLLADDIFVSELGNAVDTGDWFSFTDSSIFVMGTPILWADGYFTFGFDKLAADVQIGEYLFAGPAEVAGLSAVGLEMIPVVMTPGVDTSELDPNKGRGVQTPSAVVADYWYETEDSFAVKFALPRDQTARFYDIDSGRRLSMVLPGYNIDFPVTITSMDCPF